MFTGARIMPEQLLAQVNAVTAADIQCVAHSPPPPLLSTTPPFL